MQEREKVQDNLRLGKPFLLSITQQQEDKLRGFMQVNGLTSRASTIRFLLNIGLDSAKYGLDVSRRFAQVEQALEDRGIL